MARQTRRSKKAIGTAAIDFSAELAKKGLEPAYLVVGEEDFLAREVCLAIRRAAFGEDDSPSLSEFEGAKTPVARILDEARTLPFFGGGPRVIIVREAEALFAPAAESWAKQRKEDRGQDIEALFSYLQAPSDSASLVLVARKLDGRLKITKRLTKILPPIECKPPDERALLRWIKARAKKPPFAPDAAALLAARGASGQAGLGAIAAEVEKLTALARGRDRIGRDLVEALVAETSSDGFFDLLRPINDGRADEALRRLRGMMRDGALDRSGKRIRDVVALSTMAIGAMAWDLRQLWRAWSLQAQGRSQADIKAAIKTYGVDALIRRARQAGPGSLRRRHEALRRADLGVKGGGRAEEVLSELVLCWSLIARGERRRS